MTLPSLLFAFALSTLYGAGFHLWQGGSSRRLALYLLAGWLGFALGQLLGDRLGIHVLRLGQVNFFSATLASVIALFAGRWLATADTFTPQEK
jgi:hypothetical protein